MPLTPKQERFVAEYIETGNASEAYRLAYDAAGMNLASVNREAKSLLDHPKIAPLIAGYFKRAAESVQVTADDIARRAWEIAQQDKPDRVPALALLAKRHPEFRDKDSGEGARHLHLHGLSDSQLKALADGLGS